MTVTMTSSITVEPITVAASDAMVAMAARVSTLGEASAEAGRPIEGLIGALMRERHGSPFEHGLFTFRIRIPRFVEAEHLRHRIGFSYNFESGRYRTPEPVFYTPPAERGLTQVGKAMEYDIQPGDAHQREEVEYSLEAMASDAFYWYEEMLHKGIAREVARQVLPQNLMVSAYVTCNPRSLMHFLQLRGEGTHALWEIQQVANGYEQVFADAMPITYQEFAKEGIAP